MNIRTPTRITKLSAILIAVLALLAGVLGAGWWRASQQIPIKPNAVDIGFAQAMSRHHQQAILMAQLMLDGRPTPLKALARNIAGAQMRELGEMQGWLKLWNAPLVVWPPNMDWMLQGRNPPDASLKQYLLDCSRAPSGMVGLATDVDVMKLRTLTGRARDAHFLALMRAHHEGGLPMTRFAANEAQLPVVQRLAKNIVREQSQELYYLMRAQQAMKDAQAAN